MSAANRASITGVLLTLASLLLPLTLCAQQEVPEGARGHFKAGVALIERANKPADFLAAIAEFETAASLTPQWPDIHYNLAKLASEVDKPAKAIKEYGVYLALQPEATDRAKVESEIARMKEMIGIKRKIGLPGVTFASMPDGIWVINVFPGSKIGQKGKSVKNGFEKGDKIVTLNGKSVVGYTLDGFFKAIEATTAYYARRTSGPGPVVAIGVKIAGHDDFVGTVLLTKDVFRSHIIEIEEDEFADQVIKANLPVVVTFWSSGCEPCLQFIPVVEEESPKYAGKIKFINVNVDENMKLAKELKVKGVPSLMVFKGGSMVSTDTGKLPKEKVEEILKSAAAR